MTQSPWIFVSIVMVTGFLWWHRFYAILPLIAAMGADLNGHRQPGQFHSGRVRLAYAFGFLIFGPLAGQDRQG